MGRSKVHSVFFGDTGLLVDGDQALSQKESDPSNNLKRLQMETATMPAAETPFTPPPHFSNQNSGGFGMGREPDTNFDEVLLQNK